MPRKKKTDGKAAKGMGNIRQKTVTRNGKEYPYWEGRYTVGFDPGTGKQIQRSVTGKTQKEAAQKLKAALAALDAGTYAAPCKMTVGSWMDIWDTDYLGGVKPYTVADYTANIKNHIKPALGAVKLEALNTHTIQGFYNKLVKPLEEGGKGLPPRPCGISTACSTGRSNRLFPSVISAPTPPTLAYCPVWRSQKSSPWTRSK